MVINLSLTHSIVVFFIHLYLSEIVVVNLTRFKTFAINIFFRNAFPSHKFIGEETTAASDGLIGSFCNDPTWIIDPIDGTMNFVHSHPMVSISVGLVINKRIVIGIVFAPVIDKMYTAIKGKGAFLNGKPMKVK